MLSAGLMGQDALSLFECQKMARDHAPRLGDLEVIQEMGDTRIEQAGSSWYPSLDLNGKLSYQSDVVTVAVANPDVQVGFAEVPKDQYGLNLDIIQNIYDVV